MNWRQASPRIVAEAILDALFAHDGCGGSAPAVDADAVASDPLPDPVTGGPTDGFAITDYQASAVRRARRILRRRDGVLIADGVGLGKTYIALALIREELGRGGEVVVVVPAALRDQWRRALSRAVREIARPHRDGVRLLSHASLSRSGCGGVGRSGVGPTATPALVIVDEAHRFRNPATVRYQALARLCVGARVVLLTATPVNNRIADLHSLIRLFARDDAFRDLAVPGLAAAFEAARANPTGMAEVRRVAEAVMVRRTRDTIRQSSRGTEPGALDTPQVAPGDTPHDAPRDSPPGARPLAFPRRAPPAIVRYADDRLAPMARCVARLELAPYDLPARGRGGGGPGGGAALVRLGLLKRLDSSRAAFRRSLAGQLRFAHAFLDAAATGRLLRPPDVAAGPAGDGDPHQLLLLDLIADEAAPDVDLDVLGASVRRDLRRLRALRRSLGDAAPAAASPDPKLDALERLCRRLAPEKVLVFSEYRDTAEAIWRRLARRTRVARIDGSGAWLGLRPASRGAVVRRFAPRTAAAAGSAAATELAGGAAAMAGEAGREGVDVLVATDVLAEGLDLQDARHVVSFDLPWNPVRLLQRIGRVDRLGSPHAEVVPHLFLPTPAVDGSIRLTPTVRSKLRDMTAAVGLEKADRLLARLLGEGAGAPPEPREAAEAGHGSSSGVGAGTRSSQGPDEPPLEPLRAMWEASRARPGDGPGPGAHDHAPAPALVAVGPGAAPPALVLARWRGSPWLLEWHPRHGALADAGRDAADALGRALDSDAFGPSPGRRQLDALASDLRRHFRALAATTIAPAALPPGDPATRLARRLRRAAARAPLGVTGSLLPRIEGLLGTLDRPLPAHLAAEGRRLAGSTSPDTPLPELISRLEDLQGRDGGTAADPLSGGGPARGSKGRGRAARNGAKPVIVAVLLAASAPPPEPVDDARHRH